MPSASSIAASSNSVFFTVNLLGKKNSGLHRENAAQNGGAHTKRTFVLILRNVTRKYMQMIDVKGDSSGSTISEKFLILGESLVFPKKSEKGPASAALSHCLRGISVTSWSRAGCGRRAFLPPYKKFHYLRLCRSIGCMLGWHLSRAR